MKYMKDMKTYIAPAIVWMEMEDELLSSGTDTTTYKSDIMTFSEEEDVDYRQSKSFTAPDGDSNWDDFGF